MSLIVKLPFPDSSLFPNRKNGKHWTATSAAKDTQKSAAYMLTKEAMQTTPCNLGDGNIPLSLVYLTPDKRKRDLDNMLAASKALIDGMAQALGVDDSRFRPILVDWVQGPKGGALMAAVGISIVSGVSL